MMVESNTIPQPQRGSKPLGVIQTYRDSSKKTMKVAHPAAITVAGLRWTVRKEMERAVQMV